MKDLVDDWLTALRDDAAFNLSSYVDCFLSENLLRKYLIEKMVPLKPGIKATADKWRLTEDKLKGEGNISIEIRKNKDDLYYLDMKNLAESVEGHKTTGQYQSLWADAKSYVPARNVVGHTGLLTTVAKTHLTATHENIKARVKKLVSDGK